MQTIQKLLKFYAHVQRIHQPNWQNQHSNLRQLNSLPIKCSLPLQRGWFMYFGLVGSHNQLCTFHVLIDLLVTNLFYIDAQHRMIKAARWDKNDMLQSVPRSAGCSLSDVTLASSRSPNQPIRLRRNQKHQSMLSWTFLCRPKTVMFQSVGELCLA